MPRPHTEFIQSQSLPWQPWGPRSDSAEVEARLLSQDPDSGATTALVRYPPGFEATESFHWAEEWLILTGNMTVSGADLATHDYLFCPPSSVVEINSEPGAIALTFLNPRPEGSGSEDLVRIATPEVPWGAGVADPNLGFMGMGRKVLRNSVAHAERTLLLTMAPQAYPPGLQGPRISHPCVEECFLFSGDIVTEYGVMGPGAYFWRPPNIPHGPHGSRSGAFMLIRFVEGLHENAWSEEVHPFRLHPEYAPILPDVLKPYSSNYTPATPF